MTDVTSYCPINLVSKISRVHERLILDTIDENLNQQDWMPDHYFGFRQGAGQCHRLSSIITKTKEDRKYSIATSLDVNSPD